MLDCCISLTKYVVYLIRLLVHDIPALSDRPAVDIQVGALEVTLETSNERTSALELEIASEDVPIVAKITQVDGAEGRSRMAEEGDWVM